MLRTLECTGFKSFSNFHLNFKPGLNILVGPNGSGKTNIILLLEFLGLLTRSPLIEAIGHVGGAGRIFRRALDGTLTDTIKFRVTGYGTIADFRRTTPDSVRYDYSATIHLSTKENTIVFLNQRLKMTVILNQKTVVDGAYDESVDIETTFSNQEIRTKIHKFEDKLFEKSRVNIRSDAQLTRQQMTELITQSCQHTAKDTYLFESLGQFIRGASLLHRDLLSARSFNIIPDRVRGAEDIGTLPSIESDGGGLAATLYALKTVDIQSNDYYMYNYRYRPRAFFENPEIIVKKIIEYSKLVNPEIVDIDVDSDPIEAKLRIVMTISYDSGTLKLPFSLVSDGTAKWFTLVTAIATNSNLFAIEEPENFLHPLMQIEIVRIVRDQYERVEQDRFALISTHSETILNQCQPSEIIIVEMKRGRTEARRPENAEDVSGQIKETGFGLGYYYIAGAVE